MSVTKTNGRRKPSKNNKGKRPFLSVKRRGNAGTSLPRGDFGNFNNLTPFAVRRNQKLMYTQNGVLTSGAAGVFGAEADFRINGMFDPDFTGVGHQPYGFDQLALIYKKYKVNGVLFDITFTDPSTDGMSTGVMLVTPNQITPLAAMSIQRATELGGMIVTKPLNNSGSQIAHVKQYVPGHIFMGITKQQFSSDIDNTTAFITADPPALSGVAFIRLAAAQYGGVGGGTLNYKLTLTYYCTMYDRIVLPQS